MQFSSGETSPTVATVLLPVERARVDAAGSGCFAVVHRDTIPEAVRIVRPYAVDVASGVEHSPGRKDVEKIRRFIGSAREAAAKYS